MGRRRRSVIDTVVIVTLKNTQVSSKPIYRHLALYRPCKKADISALGIVRVKEILINKPQPWCDNVIFACLLCSVFFFYVCIYGDNPIVGFLNQFWIWILITKITLPWYVYQITTTTITLFIYSWRDSRHFMWYKGFELLIGIRYPNLYFVVPCNMKQALPGKLAKLITN